MFAHEQVYHGPCGFQTPGQSSTISVLDIHSTFPLEAQGNVSSTSSSIPPPPQLFFQVSWTKREWQAQSCPLENRFQSWNHF